MQSGRRKKLTGEYLESERNGRMKDGFIKVAAATPDIKVADCEFNRQSIKKCIDECALKGAKIIVFPELCITGYTCGDLFLQDTLLDNAKKALAGLVEESTGVDAVCIVGMPLMKQSRLYNVAVLYRNGEVLGVVPKKNIPNYSEFYEARHFAGGNSDVTYINITDIGIGIRDDDDPDYDIPFGCNILFKCIDMPGVNIAVELCEDVWMPVPPSCGHATAGATIVANLSASDEITGKDIYRKDLIKGQSGRLIAGYIYADAGEGESSTDLVFSGHNIIAENGTILAESERFSNGFIISEIDTGRLVSERRRMTSFPVDDPDEKEYEIVEFNMNISDTALTRRIDPAPFVPGNIDERDKRCNEIFNIQSLGLKKRLVHTGCKCAVVGVSGGLDSTLALIVTARAFDLAGIPRDKITGVTMPCFGTTDRTYSNAVSLIKALGATFKEIDIKDSVRQHFKDIGHDENEHDVTYENCQARERTQILMDIANKSGGMVIGTGDLSELALGWATYNGDHMSMYGVNASVPKTLVRYLVSYYAGETDDEGLRNILNDILDTPVSPELLPPEDGVISQKTEEIVGPYELHDFFLYYMMRFGFRPSKIFRLAVNAFEGTYNEEVISKWIKVFYKRFFAQQFKRSCLPDGPKVGSVALSPRGDWRMPSDAVVRQWLEELD